MHQLSLSRRAFMGGAAAVATGAAPLTARTANADAFVFAYFQNADDGHAGMRLAISTNGRAFRALRGGLPVVAPEVGPDRILRDPCVFQDPRSRLFHMVWTTGWRGDTIGHASSPDLLHWGPQQAIPVMAGIEGVRNCWAPEGIFDPSSGEFVLFWASTVDPTNMTTTKRDHRIYRSTTRDFLSFTPARLLFDPGFNVIDATFLRDEGRLIWFVKNETANPPAKFIQWCEASSPLGPFGTLSGPITPAWTEGPTAYRSGSDIILLFDRYRENRFGAVASSNLRDWRDISSEIEMPAKASHGTVLPVDHAVAKRLLRHL